MPIPPSPNQGRARLTLGGLGRAPPHVDLGTGRGAGRNHVCQPLLRLLQGLQRSLDSADRVNLGPGQWAGRHAGEQEIKASAVLRTASSLAGRPRVRARTIICLATYSSCVRGLQSADWSQAEEHLRKQVLATGSSPERNPPSTRGQLGAAPAGRTVIRHWKVRHWKVRLRARPTLNASRS